MNPDQNLAAIVERLSQASVCCVGDVMLDQFVYGALLPDWG